MWLAEMPHSRDASQQGLTAGSQRGSAPCEKAWGWCGAGRTGVGLVRGGAHGRVVPDEIDRLEELLVEHALEEVLLCVPRGSRLGD